MTSKLTRERLEKIKSWRETYGAGSNVMLPAEEAADLARMALAAMDSEPVAWMHNNNNIGIPAITTSPKIGQYWMTEFKDVQPLYRHAQPAQTGVDDDVRNIIGLLETNEWAEHCTETVLGSRLEAEITRLIGCAQPAPVVPSFEEWLSAINRKPLGWVKDAMREAYDACRAAMLQAGNSPVIGIDPASGPDRTVEVRYVAPPGYVMVPMRLTAENGAKGALSGEFSETKFVNCPECFGDDECETCDGSGRIEITVPVSWTNIKEIWAKGVEHFETVPQEEKTERKK